MSQANLWNPPTDDIALAIWSKANQIDHEAIVFGIAQKSSRIVSIALTTGVTGYTSAPSVAIAAPDQPGGTQATATCAFTGSGSNQTLTFTITNPGLGYTFSPAVTLSGGGGSGAKATATVNYVKLQLPPLDPVPLNDQITWQNNHLLAHQAMLAAVGKQSTDLSGIDFTDASEEELTFWAFNHIADHIAVASGLAGFLPNGS